MTRSDVLVVGAGPTGLVLALWLTKLGVNVSSQFEWCAI
jgi:2-polyprenyl-6-methoxyphenol hydroxylase-like FAD-dependent oxidoreductase